MRQVANKQTNRQRRKQILLGGGNSGQSSGPTFVNPACAGRKVTKEDIAMSNYGRRVSKQIEWSVRRANNAVISRLSHAVGIVAIATGCQLFVVDERDNIGRQRLKRRKLGDEWRRGVIVDVDVQSVGHSNSPVPVHCHFTSLHTLCLPDCRDVLVVTDQCVR